MTIFSFIPSQAILPSHNPTKAISSRSLSRKFRVVGCQRSSSGSSRQVPSRTTISSDDDGKGLILEPRRAPALLQNPEAVLALLTFGFVSTAAYLANTARRVTTAVTTRAKLLMETRNIKSRLQSRERERSFLQSAVDATYATLQNTSSYLEAQRERARIAELRLTQLETQHQDLRDVERRREFLAQQLVEAEAELAARKVEFFTDESTLADLRHSVDKHQQTLQHFDVDYKRAQEDLKEAERNAQEALDADCKQFASLEAELNRKDRLIKCAVDATQRANIEIERNEEHVNNLQDGITTALTLIEEQRVSINKMSKRVHEVKSDVERKRDGALSAQQEHSREHMQTAIAHISKQQESVKQTLSQLNGRAYKHQEEQQKLRDALHAKDETLNEIRGKLTQIGLSTQLEDTTTVTDTTLTNLDSDSNSDSDTDSVGSNSNKPNDHRTNSDNESTEGNALILSTNFSVKNKALLSENDADLSSSSEVPATTPTKKRPRGRPRKTDKNQEVSTSGEDVKPKRGRGRSRKSTAEVEMTGETTDQLVTKRKRGRPRKSSVS